VTGLFVLKFEHNGSISTDLRGKRRNGRSSLQQRHHNNRR